MVKAIANQPVGNLDKCPVDGTLFEKIPTTKVYCSTKCKRQGDNVTRRARKYAARLQEYRRLGKLLSVSTYTISNADEASMLRKQLANAYDNMTTQARVLFACFVIIGVLTAVLIAKL